MIERAVAGQAGVRRENGEERPLGERGARTRARILAAAYGVFCERGYGSTSVEDVARAAEVSLGTVYQYFRDRAELMVVLVDLAVSELLGPDRPPWDAGRGRLGLRRMIADFVRRYRATAPFQAAWDEAALLDAEIGALRRDLEAAFVRSVEVSLVRGAEQGLLRVDLDHAEVARALTAMVDRYCLLRFGPGAPDPQPPADDVIDLLTTLWADAIALREPHVEGAPLP